MRLSLSRKRSYTYLSTIFCVFSPCFILINVAKAELGVIESRKKLWLNTYVIASAKEIDALSITLFSCIHSTNVQLSNYCTKIFVIVVNTCL